MPLSPLHAQEEGGKMISSFLTSETSWNVSSAQSTALECTIPEDATDIQREYPRQPLLTPSTSWVAHPFPCQLKGWFSTREGGYNITFSSESWIYSDFVLSPHPPRTRRSINAFFRRDFHLLFQGICLANLRKVPVKVCKVVPYKLAVDSTFSPNISYFESSTSTAVKRLFFGLIVRRK